jgi:tetratricopeptide (TPR) repeat protein
VLALALGATIALGAAAGASYLLWRHLHPAPLSASVVLADFENTTGDKDFDVALNRVFQIELEQSPFLEIVPRSTAVALYNRREYTQAAALIQKANSLRSHTTERDRLTIEILYNAFGTYDYQATISSMRLFNQIFPNNATNWANLCGMYTLVGDYAQAVEAGETSLRTGVHGAQISEMAAIAYERANRLVDAKRVAAASIADGKETFDLHQVLFQIAVAEGDATARKSEGDWGFTHDKSDYALDDLGMAAASEGKVHEAAGYFSHARREVVRQGDSDFDEALVLDIAETMLNAGDLEQARASLQGLTVTGNASGHFAWLKAELGDMGPARKFIAEVHSSGETNTIHRYHDLPMLGALLALDAHQPAQAVEKMEPARPYQMVDFEIPTLRGRAEAEAGMLERAADDYRLILANRGIAPISPLYTVAHLRLARVLVMERETAAARAEFQAFLNAWKDGDPQEPLLIEAKQESAKLESK